MLLSLGVAGLPFAGADVGGFFNNPDTELLERWYQAGAFQPFFRAHAHIDTKRREPWLFGDQGLGRVAKSIRARYALLPHWYTLFHTHEVEGLPVMRPLWSLAPEDENTFAVGDSWLVGHELLVKPVTDAGAVSTQVYLPRGFVWYQFEYPHKPTVGGQTIDEAAPLDKIPVFQRSGSVVPMRMRLRRSSHTMRSDPYTLKAALDENGNAAGSLYIDDELTLAYKDQSKFCNALFHVEAKTKIVAHAECNGGYQQDINVERIILLGVDVPPSKATAAGIQAPIPFTYDQENRLLVLRKPSTEFLRVPFTINLEF
jgi:alpha 1,3-glucosidase